MASGSLPHESLLQPLKQSSEILRDDFLIGKYSVCNWYVALIVEEKNEEE